MGWHFPWGVEPSGTLDALVSPTGAFAPRTSIGSSAGKIIYDGVYLWITHPSNLPSNTLTRVLVSPFHAGTITTFTITQFTVPAVQSSDPIIGLTFDGRYVWGASRGGQLFKIDPASGSLVAYYSQPDFNSPQAITFDGYSIWVTDLTKVARFNSVTGARTGTYAASDGRSLSFDGSQVWVANRSSNSIAPIRACDGASTQASFSTPAYPENVASDGTNLWVTSPTSRTVSIR